MAVRRRYSDELLEAGRRVLLVDADPQVRLTQGFWGPQRADVLAKDETLAGLFNDALEPDPSRLIVPTAIDGVSLLPSSPLLDTHNVPATEDSASLQLALRDFLCDVRGDFDLVLIDCPPNLYLLIQNPVDAVRF